MRYFFWWCENCPTRLRLETEVPMDAPANEPQFLTGDEGPALYSEFTRFDELQVANLCPACEHELHDYDDIVCGDQWLMGDGELGQKMKEATESERHALWRKMRQEGTRA